PNMTVEENITFGIGKEKDEGRLEEILEDTELKGLKKRDPMTLSGGQKQRVAIARVLGLKPDILLLDEPLSAVDRQMRVQLQDLIERIHIKYKTTTIMVSHDIPEIFKLADRVISIKKGSINFDGKPEKAFAKEAMSCKFKFSGEVIDIYANGVVNIVHVLIGNEAVKIIATNEEIKEIRKGDIVTVGSKAFNPVMEKTSEVL
ncbi:MAG: ATP-binding cassette domain-containing protein, partial [Flavobacteriales bacterium]